MNTYISLLMSPFGGCRAYGALFNTSSANIIQWREGKQTYTQYDDSWTTTNDSRPNTKPKAMDTAQNEVKKRGSEREREKNGGGETGKNHFV